MDAADFAPALIRIQERPPPPLAGWTLRVLIALLAGVLLWSVFGQLDIVAVAEGKLVPSGYLKIVQPAEQGIVKEILVREGEAVKAGQVLARMDPVLIHSRQMVLDARDRMATLGIHEALPGAHQRSHARWWAVLAFLVALLVFAALRALGGS